ncbi:hypothetical protein BDW59DRAFT_159821 [Aspergillus cavernicola]|uniref:CWF21 domain-containing protein n=1 Tax=Aspergillus cavernicola TaxID=176166 RepID=A0ABR4IKD0_9EURO
MSSNVGLTTPRGSGTSGYVQRNTAFLKPRNFGSGAPYPSPSLSSSGDRFGGGFGGEFKQRQPDKAILEHEMKRDIEVRVLEERERLEDSNEEIENDQAEVGKDKDQDQDKDEGEGRKILSEEEIEERCERLREKLIREMEEGRGEKKKGRKGFKAYQVHELAEAKIEESERLRRALGIRGVGGAFGGGERSTSARGEVEKRREKGREQERERLPE